MCTDCELSLTSLNNFRDRTLRAMEKLVEIRTRAIISVGMTAQQSDQTGLGPLDKDTVVPKNESGEERAVDNAYNETIGYLAGYSLNIDNAGKDGFDADNANTSADPTEPSASTSNALKTHDIMKRPSEHSPTNSDDEGWFPENEKATTNLSKKQRRPSKPDKVTM